jgi:integrase
MHPMAKGGLAATTITGHRRVLRWLSEQITLDLRQAPLPSAILEVINRTRRRKKWKWSTTTTKLATIQGAMAALPAYARMDGTSGPVLLKHSPVWSLALKAAARKAREQLGMQPKAATDAHIRQVMQDPHLTQQMKGCILLAWLSAARVGDVLKLRRADITLEGRTLTITWERGKTVAKRGPYTVSTQIPQAHLELMTQCLAHGGTTPTVFAAISGPAVKNALRQATGDLSLEQRSLRRGALQLLAANGMPLSTVILFSGHTTEKMLLAYLGFGRHAKQQNNVMIDAATLAFRA